MPFFSYDLNLGLNSFCEEVIFSNERKVTIEGKRKDILNFGIRFGILNQIKKKNQVNIFFSYGLHPCPVTKIYSSDGIIYGFKRISKRRSFHFYSFGAEINLYLVQGVSLIFGFINRSPGSGIIDYEIYFPTGKEFRSYIYSGGSMSWSLGIKTYLIKR